MPGATRRMDTASLQAIADNMPAEQRPVIQALVDILKATYRNTGQPEAAGTSVENQARQLTTVIKSIKAERYTPSDDGPIIEVALEQTALICRGKNTINYKGAFRSSNDVFYILLDGYPWRFQGGSRYDRAGLKLTVMEVGPRTVRILTSCG